MHRVPLVASVLGAVFGALTAGIALSINAQDPIAAQLPVRAYLPQVAADSGGTAVPPDATTVVASPSPTVTSTSQATGVPSQTTATPTQPAPTSVPTEPTSTPSQFRTLTVTDGGKQAVLVAELALTWQQRAKGLMGRTSLGDGEGMLFVFPYQTGGGFWMKDTPIPLDIAYLDASGRVMEVRHGEPFSLTPLIPAQPYLYVLEVSGGWFERMGMGVGAQVFIPDDLPRAQ